MISSKKIGLVTVISLCIAMVFSMIFAVLGSAETVQKSTPLYATKIFGSEIISIEILADELDWQNMLENASAEEYIMADVIVNGSKFQDVGIRPKGNSSLSQVVSSESDRYSFRLKFDEYIQCQTCFGLESFVVNNMISDNSYMREYISYDMMQSAGVDVPYFGFADIKLNGETWGLYLAVELYNSSYEQRVYGTESGMLYNVKNVEMGGGIPGEMGENEKTPPEMPENFATNQPSDGSGTESLEQEGSTQTRVSRGMGGMGSRGGNGGSLEYTDNLTESYGSIFENVVGTGDDEDYARVITALKALSEGANLESYFDVDKILRYLAVHTAVVNLDSYSSSMAQNYYIYESGGRLTILPWDYNLAWGGFQSGSASAVVNFPIDTPVSGVEMSTRPLIAKLFEQPEYLEKYHSYLQEMLNSYFKNGAFEVKIRQLSELIAPYVQADPTSFTNYEDYKTAVENLIALGNLRAESIAGQLAGTVPSTTAAAQANPEDLIDVGELSISGGKGGGMGGTRPNTAPKGGEANGRTDTTTDEGGDTVKKDLVTEFPTRGGSHLKLQVAESNVIDHVQGAMLLAALLVLTVGAALFVAKFKRNF